MATEDPWAKLGARMSAARTGTAVIDTREGQTLAQTPVPAPSPAPDAEVMPPLPEPFDDAPTRAFVGALGGGMSVEDALAREAAGADRAPEVEVPATPNPRRAEPVVEPPAAAPAVTLPGIAPEAVAQLLALAAAAQEAQQSPAAAAQQLAAPPAAPSTPVAPEPQVDPEASEDRPFPLLPELVDVEDELPAKKRSKPRRERRGRSDGASTPDEVAGPPQTATWTGGNKLLSHGFTTLLAVAMVSGPVALGLYAVSATEEAPVAVAEVSPVQWDAATLAGERGRELVAAWLGATRTDNGRLTALYSGTVATLPESGQEARDVAVAQVRSAGEGLWTVLVGADVKVAQPTEQDPDAAGWVRQFFQVPVAVAETDAGLGAQLLALPAPMPAPVVAEGLETTYRDRIATTSTLGESISGFMSALLAGAGDLSRYTTPGTALTAIVPPPYDGAEVQSIVAARADVDVENPEQGAQMDVLVDVALVRADGQKTLASYALQLTARDGRWETTAVAGTPTIAADSALVDTKTPADAPAQNATSNTAGTTDGGTE